mgnify:CR=1 FL=1
MVLVSIVLMVLLVQAYDRSQYQCDFHRWGARHVYIHIPSSVSRQELDSYTDFEACCLCRKDSGAFKFRKPDFNKPYDHKTSGFQTQFFKCSMDESIYVVNDCEEGLPITSVPPKQTPTKSTSTTKNNN